MKKEPLWPLAVALVALTLWVIYCVEVYGDWTCALTQDCVRMVR